MASLTILGEVWNYSMEKMCFIASLYLCGEAKSAPCVTAASLLHLSWPLPASHTKAEPCWIEKADLLNGSLFENVL